MTHSSNIIMDVSETTVTKSFSSSERNLSHKQDFVSVGNLLNVSLISVLKAADAPLELPPSLPTAPTPDRAYVFVGLEQVDRMSLYIYPPLSLVL
jgi:hypothetical protein